MNICRKLLKISISAERIFIRSGIDHPKVSLPNSAQVQPIQSNISPLSPTHYQNNIPLLRTNFSANVIKRYRYLTYTLFTYSKILCPSSKITSKKSVNPCLAFFILGAGPLLYSLASNESELFHSRDIRVGSYKISEINGCQSDIGNIMSQILPGRPGNLTPEQESKLKELWATALQLFGVLTDKGTSDEPDNSRRKSDTSASKKPKKKRTGIFRRIKDEEDESVPNSSLNESDDKFGQMKVFNEALANMTPESLRNSFWSMAKHDNPDALLLRFLRARQWDIEKALVMIISTMRWRLIEVHVDDDIVPKGELKALEQSNGSDPAEKKLGKDFLDQMRLGKSFLHGTDKNGRPLCLIRVRQHRIGEQCEQSLARYTVYLIETARMILAPPIDTASIVFDMTGFSMANMDYTPVKFMIRCFEANYPECLGVILVHKAPWIFQGIWKIIRGWLDPVVAGKVKFTNNVEEMEEYISKSQIIKEFGGDENWEYKYVEPIPGENDIMKDTETRDKLLHERQKLFDEYEMITEKWVHTTESESSELNSKRTDLARLLKENYWKLDPYIRAKSYYDRIGVISPGGVINHYPPNLMVPNEGPDLRASN